MTYPLFPLFRRRSLAVEERARTQC